MSKRGTSNGQLGSPMLKKSRNPPKDGSVSIERTTLNRKDLPNTHKSVSVISFNVNGLRATLKKGSIIKDMVEREKPDILCLQETKLQTQHVEEMKKKVELDGYESHWSCSETKKGYSGTAMFIRNEAFSDREIKFGLGSFKNEAVKEGRVITAILPEFNLVNVYVPNSGMKLERLNFRVSTWDLHLRDYIKELASSTNRPVILCGDLNVAHQNCDIYNAEAKHVVKVPGCTLQEQASFSQFLYEDQRVDAFRYLYPNAVGHFSFWGALPPNKRATNRGLRLDYFVLPKKLTEEENDTGLWLHDSYHLYDVFGSDHCPVGLTLICK